MSDRKKHMSPTQRSLKHMRDNGWTVCVVEKWLPPRGTMKFGRRIDVYGFADLLACRPAIGTHRPAIALVQCTTASGGNFAAHRDKILAIPEFQVWKAACGRVFLQGWRFGGKHGEKKRWILREEEL
jgi:hypothetical protein